MLSIDVNNYSENISISLQGVWKIFSDNPALVLDAIRKEGISKKQAFEKYDAVIGVADVSLDIHDGEIFCIMGLSGSGKSTLVRHLNRLLEPTSGKIFINGIDVLSLSPKSLQEFRNKNIGMVFQNFALLPHRSILDNIAMPLDIRGMNKNKRLDIAEKTLKLVDLKGWGNKFAHELSGGMQQRVGLARALCADPKFLLMDEPFSALDPLIRRQLQDEFMDLSAKMEKTTVFITHDLDEAVRIGNRIAIMRDGEIVQVGTPEEIVFNPIDDYVAEFVAGITRLKIVFANSVMLPIESYIVENGPVPSAAKRMDEKASMSDLIQESVNQDSPIVIIDKDQTEIGVITRKELLSTVLEHTEMS
jgi:glycine betaine/proline transport system ATP-binding protein